MRTFCCRLLAVVLLYVAMPAYGADCGEVAGWVGIPLCGQSTPTDAVPSVIGEADSAAADTILEAAGFDLGGVTARCSAEAADEVVGQSPGPGTLAELGTLVDLLVSNGVECVISGRAGVRLKGLRMRGL